MPRMAAARSRCASASGSLALRTRDSRPPRDHDGTIEQVQRTRVEARFRVVPSCGPRGRVRLVEVIGTRLPESLERVLLIGQTVRAARRSGRPRQSRRRCSGASGRRRTSLPQGRDAPWRSPAPRATVERHKVTSSRPVGFRAQRARAARHDDERGEERGMSPRRDARWSPRQSSQADCSECDGESGRRQIDQPLAHDGAGREEQVGRRQEGDEREAAKKRTALFRRACQSAAAAPPTRSAQPIQSAAVPCASGICAYE